MDVVNRFFSLPLEGRAAIALGVVLLLLLLLRTPILKILSLLPFLIRRLFRAVYLMLESLVSILHKRLGGTIYRVDNGLAACGGKIDAWLERWYQAWHKPKSKRVYVVLVMAVCGICYLSVTSPVFFHAEHDSWEAKGWAVYLHAERAFADFFEEQSWYDSGETVPAADELEEELQEMHEAVQIPMTVQVSSALRIRDMPTTLDSTTLGSLENGEIVIWNGELTFGFAEGKQEPWAKVAAESGLEGWVRLYYLRPEEGAELMLTVWNASAAGGAAPLV